MPYRPVYPSCRPAARIPPLSAILDIILPIFAIVLSGYLAGRFRVLGTESSESLNRFVFYVALPVLFFHSMARMAPGQAFNGPFLATHLGGQAIVFAAVLVASRLLFRERLAEASMAGMTTIFANTGYMGIPLLVMALGDQAAVPAIVATIGQSILFIALVSGLIEADLAVGGGPLGVLRDVGRALVVNPLLISAGAGVAWALTGWPLPKPVDTFCTILGAAASPCALFAIGLFLVGRSLRGDMVEVALFGTVNLIVHPLLAWYLAFRVFDMDPMWAKAAVVLAALPAGATVFVVASRYGVYVQRASALVLLTTLVSALTLSVLLGLPDSTLR